MGNPKAKVVLIEYGAPSCPICAYFFANTFPQLKQNYIDTGKIFYVFRVFPLRESTARPRKSPAACLRISISRSLTCCGGINPNGTMRNIRALTGRPCRAGPAGPDRGHERRTGRSMHQQQSRKTTASTRSRPRRSRNTTSTARPPSSWTACRRPPGNIPYDKWRRLSMPSSPRRNKRASRINA